MHKCLSANVNRKLFYTHTQYTHTYIPEWKRRVRGNAKGAQASSIRRASAIYVKAQHALGYMCDVNIARRCLCMYT